MVIRYICHCTKWFNTLTISSITNWISKGDIGYIRNIDLKCRINKWILISRITNEVFIRIELILLDDTTTIIKLIHKLHIKCVRFNNVVLANNWQCWIFRIIECDYNLTIVLQVKTTGESTSIEFCTQLECIRVINLVTISNSNIEHLTTTITYITFYYISTRFIKYYCISTIL